jgi:hypothetical protein
MDVDVRVQNVDGRFVAAIPADSDGSVLVELPDLARLANPRAQIWLLRRNQCYPGAYLAAQGKSDLQDTCASGIHPLHSRHTVGLIQARGATNRRRGGKACPPHPSSFRFQPVV